MTVSNAAASASAPEPRAIARSMFSFGMETERAFSIAFWSARFAPGSGPPSRAATMIARDSFENSFPRLASAAPFLCLIEDHLLCPDMSLLADEIEKTFVDTRVVRQLWMKGSDEEASVAEQDGLAVVRSDHLDALPHLTDARCADEDAAQG